MARKKRRSGRSKGKWKPAKCLVKNGRKLKCKLKHSKKRGRRRKK